jgi:hypothetical protein
LVVASSLLTGFFVGRKPADNAGGAGPSATEKGAQAAKPPKEAMPWGDLLKSDIQIERPGEYVAFEFGNSRDRDWHFGAVTPAQAREVMVNCGMPPHLIAHALEHAKTVGGKFLVTPDAELITALASGPREKLYAALAQQPENYYMHSPFSFSTADFAEVFAGSSLDEATKRLVNLLAYQRGERTYFSDLGFVLDRHPAEADRLRLVKALSRIAAVMVRLQIGPDADIDKLVNYWAAAPGVRPMDVRPLLESVQRMEGGGAVSLMYLLPPFARERLFTFPLNSKSGEADVDCHWSTMNFFKDKPDDRFADVNYTSAYIASNYYNIAQPSRYGDLVLVLDDKGGVIHSAVYIADDIVFTKNGRAYAQPWLLMRLKDVVTAYSFGKAPRLVYYRNNAT